MGPAEPSCTSAAVRPVAPLTTESSGGGVHSLSAVIVASEAPRPKSASPRQPRTTWRRERRIVPGSPVRATECGGLVIAVDAVDRVSHVAVVSGRG